MRQISFCIRVCFFTKKLKTIEKNDGLCYNPFLCMNIHTNIEKEMNLFWQFYYQFQ